MLVVFDGLDGGGKSTLVAAVAAMARLPSTSIFKFPSSESAPGKLVRKIFAGEERVDRKAMIYLMTADALCRMDELRTASRDGLAIADRYSLSSGWVYQTCEGWDIDELYGIVRPNLFLIPDMTFIVDVPAKVSLDRIEARAALGGPARNSMYENQLSIKRDKYLAYAQMQPFGPCTLVDGTQHPGRVQDLVHAKLKEISAWGA